MAPPTAPLSKSQKKRRNKKLKSKLKGDDTKPEVQIPEPLTTVHTVVPPDSQHEASVTGLEDRLEETISENDLEDKKASSSIVNLVNKRIVLQNKKASRLAFYTLKSPSELNEDQCKSVATLPIVQATIKELETLKKAIESLETKEAKEFERKHAEDEKVRQERMNQTILDSKEFKEFQMNRFSAIISLIRLSAHLRSSERSPLTFPLNSEARRIIQLVVKTLTSFKGSQKDKVLSGLLKSEGEFEGLSYDIILFITNLYRNSQIVEELTNVPYSKTTAEGQVDIISNVGVDDYGFAEADEGQSDTDSDPRAGSPRNPTDDDDATNISSEEMFKATAETTTEGKYLEENAKMQAELEELKCKLAELERNKLETARKREEEEETRQAQLEELRRKLIESEQNRLRCEDTARKREDEAIKRAELEESRRKMVELERDRLLLEEVARKLEEEKIRVEESRRKLAELERDRPIWEEAARKRMHEEKIAESKSKLTRMERDKPLWEEVARKRKEEELRQKEEERARLEKEERRAAERKRREEQELERQAQEREKSKELLRSQMFLTVPKTPNNPRWTDENVLKNYTDTATRFDSTTYTTANPLKFHSIPWPVPYRAFSINSINWEAVEKFFQMMERYLPDEEYEDLVDKSHKRFHPDRWRSRKILTSIKDELEREILEEAGNTVAQALTPLWKRVTGRE